MQFSKDDYNVTLEGMKVALLRKEFLLLQFLYEHKDKIFSRNDLLDAVWPLEEPTDRTVDDHIYRLRKKLFPFRHILSITTVKGLGYCLKMADKTEGATMPVPDEIAEQANQLFNTFYKYGQGKALRELATNKVLGFPNDGRQETVLLWMESDFKTLLEKLGQTKSVFVPLLLYGFVEEDTVKVIHIHEDILKRNILDEKERMDISCFSLPFLYLKIDKPDQAINLVQTELNAIKTEDHGFLPLLHIMKTIIFFYSHKMVGAEKELVHAENVLTRLPFAREQGAFTVLQGLFQVAKNENQQGEAAINIGINLIHQSGHSYYFLFIYQMLTLLLPKANADKRLIHYYKKEAANYYKHTNLHRLKAEIEGLVYSFL